MIRGMNDTHDTALFLSPAEAASRVQVDARTLQRWCKAGRLPAVRVGRQWRIAERDLIEFVEEETRHATAVSRSS